MLAMDSKSAFESWTLGTIWSSVASASWGQLMTHTTIGSSGAIYGLIGWNIMNLRYHKTEQDISMSALISIFAFFYSG